MINFIEAIEKLKRGKALSRAESKHAVLSMMEGSLNASQTTSLLTELHRKGETVEEIIGFTEAMREKCARVSLNGLRVLDTCGTGGDQKNTFNISTIAAFVLAGCGIPVVKHGNRAASSACGSADLLQAMNISFRMTPEQVQVAMEKANFAFLFAPDYHPATKSVVAVRKQIGTPTIFNLLGPMTNPAFPAAQVIGVFDRDALPLMEQALRILDPEKRALLIHSVDGYDEATPSADFIIRSTYDAPIIENARTFGFYDCRSQDLAGASPSENAAIAFDVLCGEPGARRDTVLLNSILGYMAYYPEATIQKAKEAVEESIDSGAARQVVQRLQELFPA